MLGLVPSTGLYGRVVSAGSWTLFGYGLTQAMRFGGNLVLTRLLFPEAFGVMAIAQSVLIGINMLSDVGIDQFIIQNKVGHTRTIVNAAFTLQALRGVAIWITCCALAIPLSVLYGISELTALLPALGLSALMGGVASTNVIVASRSLKIWTTILLEIGSVAVTLLGMLILAWITHSVWALVFGNLLGAAARSAASHVWIEGERNRFVWNRDVFQEIGRFGSWIFWSTAATFLVGEGNRLVMGAFLTVRELAFYAIAASISVLPLQVAQQIGARVLFPALAEVARERPERFAAAVKKARLFLLVPHALAGVAFASLGQEIISLLYDYRYRPAGGMLSLLALGMFPQAATMSYGPVFLALGKVKTNTFLIFVQLAVQISSMTLGLYLDGSRGLILGLGITQWVLYPFYALAYAKHSIWQPVIDLPILLASVAIGWYVLRMSYPGVD